MIFQKESQIKHNILLIIAYFWNFLGILLE